MSSRFRVNCQACGKHESEVGPISWRGKCGTCGPAIAERANDELHNHAGPTFEHWRRRLAASVGAVIPDNT